MQHQKSIKGNKYLNLNIGVNIINHYNIECTTEYPLKYAMYWIPYFWQHKLPWEKYSYHEDKSACSKNTNIGIAVLMASKVCLKIQTGFNCISNEIHI